MKNHPLAPHAPVEQTVVRSADSGAGSSMLPTEAGTLWIVIPTYNEAENLEILVPLLEAQCAGRTCQILIVDDASPDGTEEVVGELRTRYGNVTLHRRSGKRGLGSALRDGLSLALADPRCTRICTLDADFSHDPVELPALLAAAERAAFVQGSRYMPGGRILNWPWRRRVLSWGINTICRLSGGQLREHTTNYRIYDRRAAAVAIEQTATAGFEWVILASLAIQEAGLPITEVPITFKERERGTSKLSPIALSRYGPFAAGLIATRISRLARGGRYGARGRPPRSTASQSGGNAGSSRPGGSKTSSPDE